MKRMAMVSLLTGTMMLAPLLTSGVDAYIIDTGIYIQRNDWGRWAGPHMGASVATELNVDISLVVDVTIIERRISITFDSGILPDGLPNVR